ncbi:MAG: methyltransferase domain-containing protein [Asticcacaulis sp.]|nr:methyltransferase domain-containing protein [Asticcacaulis sp.]
MTAADAIIDLYERHADAWAQGRAGVVFEAPWLDRFAAHLPVAGSVLDIGCGSGDPISRYFLNSGFNVEGIDSSPSLIAICRDKFPAQDWTVADMRNLKLGKTFDGLIAWHSFFHLSPEDQRQMFPVFQNHSHSASILMFTSGPDAGEVIGQWRGEPLYHGSLSPAEYRHLLDAHGFDLIDHVTSDPNCGHATIWLAKAR